ncbi:IS5 family transposase [Roseisolibacter sp. H3M3-2]|uniref:IS5 family transposase n=1 Tax=Roseisolibacter sp. H3M3-2 TaxID=3031323 RepID=UPI0023D990D7|nr:IS5 family transposase [Roseisolibacter sp. H3M3-2]MDF1503235.1 IS5 family transposase [Roseisolibacter sp. H3M3-2]
MPAGEPPDHALGRSRGGFSTKLSLVTDGRGLGLAVAVHAGQASDLAAAPALLDSVRVPGARGAPRRYPDALAGDKGYSFGPVRRWCRRHRVTPVLPRREDQPRVRRRRWTAEDRRLYRRRHVIECTVGHLKEFRRVAQRADKLAVSYRAWAVLGLVRLTLRRYFSDGA